MTATSHPERRCLRTSDLLLAGPVTDTETARGKFPTGAWTIVSPVSRWSTASCVGDFDHLVPFDLRETDPVLILLESEDLALWNKRDRRHFGQYRY